MTTNEAMERYLFEGGYKSVEDWASDSDYFYDATEGVWLDEMGNDVDIEACFFFALEASGYLDGVAF